MAYRLRIYEDSRKIWRAEVPTTPQPTVYYFEDKGTVIDLANSMIEDGPITIMNKFPQIFQNVPPGNVADVWDILFGNCGSLIWQDTKPFPAKPESSIAGNLVAVGTYLLQRATA